MSERIDILDKGKPSPFLDGPAEFLVATMVEKLKAVPQFKALFGDNIDTYKRMDYGISSLPALRVYNEVYDKAFESWFEEGDVILDVILPASLRRDDLERVQSAIASALIQQFRRPSYFAAVEEGGVPGLNELGKRVHVDKSMGFEWADGIVPLTQMTVNFRIDLRQWDEYLERENRTKDDPFIRTLADLERLVGTIPGLNDAKETQVEVGTDQKI